MSENLTPIMLWRIYSNWQDYYLTYRMIKVIYKQENHTIDNIHAIYNLQQLTISMSSKTLQHYCCLTITGAFTFRVIIPEGKYATNTTNKSCGKFPQSLLIVLRNAQTLEVYCKWLNKTLNVLVNSLINTFNNQTTQTIGP